MLINNAGLIQTFGYQPAERVTPEGLNVEFAVNVLGHFYLTQLLLPTLISSAKSSTDGKVRVLNVSSVAHMFSKMGENGPIDYRTLEGPQKSFGTDGYPQSKSVGLHQLHQIECILTFETRGTREIFCSRTNLRGDMGTKESFPFPFIQVCAPAHYAIFSYEFVFLDTDVGRICLVGRGN